MLSARLDARAAGVAAGSFTELQRERARVPEDAKWEKVERIYRALNVVCLELVEHRPN
jgi:hypothetical protein